MVCTGRPFRPVVWLNTVTDSLELSKQETIEREFGNLLKIKDNYPKVVVSGEKMFENTYEGIEHIYIRDFLSSVLLHSITRVI